MSRGLVLADDAFVDHAVNGRYRQLVGGRCGGAVASLTGIHNILDKCTHSGAQTHVVLAGFLRLAGALLS